jgi:hypothetical protein
MGVHVLIFVIFLVTNFFLLLGDNYSIGKFNFDPLSIDGMKDITKIIGHSFYITSTTHILGYGDITPESFWAKSSTILHKWSVYLFTAGFFTFNSNNISEIDANTTTVYFNKLLK